MAELYSAVTGIEVNSTDLKASAELVWKDWRMLNCNSGFERKDDEPPDVWFTPLKVENQELHLMDYFHTRKLYKKDIEKYLDDYYDERNWDKEKGIPVK
jgi:aldehyde:ferredoxin oxidoreductase